MWAAPAPALAEQVLLCLNLRRRTASLTMRSACFLGTPVNSLGLSAVDWGLLRWSSRGSRAVPGLVPVFGAVRCVDLVGKVLGSGSRHLLTHGRREPR